MPVAELLPAWPLLSAFLAASFILAVTPGPAVFYIVSRSLLQGRRFGLTSVAGVALGSLGNALGAAFGLAAVLAVSATAFAAVKYAGAAYLIYLGIQALRAPPTAPAADIGAPAGSLARVFRDGLVVALLNPNTALFFAAFLPQFMDAEKAPVLQASILGAIFVAIAAVTDTAYALAAGSVAPRLARARRIRRLGPWLAGGTFIGLGLLTALSGVRK